MGKPISSKSECSHVAANFRTMQSFTNVCLSSLYTAARKVVYLGKLDIKNFFIESADLHVSEENSLYALRLIMRSPMSRAIKVIHFLFR